MRLMAGIAIPAPMPINTRPKIKPVIDEPYAITMAPTTFAAMPQVSNRRAWPLSAYGAIVNWAINEVKNPAAMMMPRPVS